MLVAVTNGKAGRLPGEIAKDFSWRQAFSISEDLLTASVFSRLAYLDGPLLWSILQATFEDLPNHQMAELLDVEFWPRWDEHNDAGSTVEPDVFLKFSVGDPMQRIDIIVEAKLGSGTTQYAEQWRRQWNAYHKNREAEGDTALCPVYLLAIGGIGTRADKWAETLRKELHSKGIQIEALAANWDRLLSAVLKQRQHVEDKNKQRIMADIVTALGLASYREALFLSELASPKPNWARDLSKRSLPHLS